MQEILTLMYPSDRIADAAQSLLEDMILSAGYTPLRLARTGKTKLVLYVEASNEDKASYAAGCHWGWVLCCCPHALTLASTPASWAGSINSNGKSTLSARLRSLTITRISDSMHAERSCMSAVAAPGDVACS